MANAHSLEALKQVALNRAKCLETFLSFRMLGKQPLRIESVTSANTFRPDPEGTRLVSIWTPLRPMADAKDAAIGAPTGAEILGFRDEMP